MRSCEAVQGLLALLACAWFALPGILDDESVADQGDESDLTQPAFSLLGEKAGYLYSIHISPAPSIELAYALKNAIHTLCVEKD